MVEHTAHTSVKTWRVPGGDGSMKMHELMCRDYYFFGWALTSLPLYAYTLPTIGHAIIAWGSLCACMIGVHMILEWRDV